MIILPRQARGKHRERTQKRCRFSHQLLQDEARSKAQRDLSEAETLTAEATELRNSGGGQDDGRLSHAQQATNLGKASAKTEKTRLSDLKPCVLEDCAD
jgi:hypothetical protein